MKKKGGVKMDEFEINFPLIDRWSDGTVGYTDGD